MSRKFNSPEAEQLFLLRSIRTMLVWFTTLTVLAIVTGLAIYTKSGA